VNPTETKARFIRAIRIHFFYRSDLSRYGAKTGAWAGTLSVPCFLFAIMSAETPFKLSLAPLTALASHSRFNSQKQDSTSSSLQGARISSMQSLKKSVICCAALAALAALRAVAHLLNVQRLPALRLVWL
jgi:hypothetical protein